MTAQAGSASSLSSQRIAAAPDAALALLRRALRLKRAALSSTERSMAARGIVRRAMAARLLRPGMRVAVYLSVRGEIDLAPLIERARSLRCALYLPRIVNRRSGRMEFRAFTHPASLRRNRLGILEPAASVQRIAPQSLDRVFVPLVGFDSDGHRLGTGGGFYDRRFAFLKAGRQWRRPRLIGVAYELQRLPGLAARPWDIALDAVVTEHRLYRAPAR